MADKITIEALEPHTHQGESYGVGDTYVVDSEQLAASIAVQGKGIRTDRVAVAKATAKAAEKSRAAKPAKAAKKAGRKGKK